MKILHTSDWHIGRTLYGRRRYEEFEAFLAWLLATVEREEIAALLIAGDVFDSSTPGIRAQEIYYRFLCRVARSCCRHVVAIAGNHDSPSFLEAPRDLLRALDVHVVGAGGGKPTDEVLVLRNRQNDPELIVCAVPYLRDREIRTIEAGESVAEKEGKLLDGIRAHYLAVCRAAEETREAIEKRIPIVAMGHLFTAGGRTVEGDGVRELYVGSLAHVASIIFPESIDYLALGHLHVPQVVNGAENRRYSGSPLPMGFGEAGQEKTVVVVEFTENQQPQAAISLRRVPVFQRLERIQGGLERIITRLHELIAEGGPIWLEVVYDGGELIADLRERLEEVIRGSQIEILRIRNNRVMERVLNRLHIDESLDDLEDGDVFLRCLEAHDIPVEQRPELLLAYRQAVMALADDDSVAEGRTAAPKPAGPASPGQPSDPGHIS
jgi:DNA repair protein SbcD/Mre11